MMIEGSGSIPLTSGSGSGTVRPKNTWIRWIRIRIRWIRIRIRWIRIRIRIRNTASILNNERLNEGLSVCDAHVSENYYVNSGAYVTVQTGLCIALTKTYCETGCTVTKK